MKKRTRRELLLGASAAVSAGLTGRVAAGAAPRAVVRKSGDAVSLENEYIRATFSPAGNGIKQEYFARSGRAWMPILTGLQPPSPRPAGTSPLYADQNVARDYRILVSGVRAKREGGRASSGSCQCRARGKRRVRGRRADRVTAKWSVFFSRGGKGHVDRSSSKN